MKGLMGGTRFETFEDEVRRHYRRLVEDFGFECHFTAEEVSDCLFSCEKFCSNVVPRRVYLVLEQLTRREWIDQVSDSHWAIKI